MIPPPVNIPFAISVEVELPAAQSLGTRVNFPDVPQIRNRKVVAMATYTSTVAVFNSPFSLNTLVDQADGSAVFVTLSDDKSNLFVKEMPYLFYACIDVQSDLRFFEPGRVLAINKCFLTLSRAVVGTPSAFFTFFYE